LDNNAKYVLLNLLFKINNIKKLLFKINNNKNVKLGKKNFPFLQMGMRKEKV
jgi:hypothetical protein